jgi:ArsR family transcriptional regulator, zinc-responsive transcriptional repressor
MSRTITPPTDKEMTALEGAADCLRTLAHPVRLRMLQMLLKERYRVGELAEACAIAPHVASEHLRLLQRCGFLKADRVGRSTYYQVIDTHVEPLLACLRDRFDCGCG